jgi:tRNA (cytidine/uridine-2'-O-)-methyltransferase
MFNVVLVHPEIPQNTGNIIRLCANTGCQLHLIEPLGFPLDSAKMRRAGLDYHEFEPLQVHQDWKGFLGKCQPDLTRLFALSTKGQQRPSDQRFEQGDWLVFGSEGAGLPSEIRDQIGAAQLLRLPMRPNNRSLNLSNAVAITVFEAWRQHDFAGAV